MVPFFSAHSYSDFRKYDVPMLKEDSSFIVLNHQFLMLGREGLSGSGARGGTNHW